MSNNKAKEMTVNYTDLDVARISSTELQENERSKGQRIAFPRYEHPTLGPNQALMMQFPFIKLETYGVPRAGEYYKNDSDRAFVKVPLNTSVPEVATLVEKVKELDAYFASEAFASTLVGKKWNKYKYQPIFREANVQADEDSDDETAAKKKSTGPKLPYLKLKIDTDYGTNAIKTKLFRSVTEGGKRQRNEVPADELQSVDDLARIVSYQSNFRPIVRLVKFWAQPISKKDPMWGATLKIVKAEVEPTSKGNGLYKEYMNSDAFLDDDDGESKQTQQSAPKVVTTVATKVAQVESDDDSEEETKPVESTKKVVAQVESDDDDDEETKPAPKSKTPVKVATKVVAQVESDDEDEEESKPATKKAPAKVATKVVAQVESDDDEEETKPAPKSKAPTKATRGGKGGKTATV